MARLAEAIGLSADKYTVKEPRGERSEVFEVNRFEREAEYLSQIKSKCSNCKEETDWSNMISPTKSSTNFTLCDVMRCSQVIEFHKRSV